MAGIQEHVIQGIPGGSGGDDPPCKPILGEHGDPAGMINMGMGEYHGGEFGPVYGKFFIFLPGFFSPALEHAAVQ